MAESRKKTKPERGPRLGKLSILISVVAGLVLAALLASLCVVSNVRVQQSRTNEGFVRVQDLSCREIERAEAPIGVVEEYRFTLGETLKIDTCLAFYTVHQYAEVYLDGQNIYSLKLSEDNRIGKTVGSNWAMIPLYREDAGKEIRVEITPVYESFRNREVEFLIGSRLSIYRDRLSQDLPQLILGVIAVFVGLIFLCIAGYCLLQQRRGGELAALGLFSVMMGLWRLTDTRFTPFIFPDKPVLMFYISVTMLMLGMIPLIKSIEDHFNKISRRILDGCCIVTALVGLVQLLLHIFGVADLRESLFVTHIMIVVGAAIIIGNVIYDLVKYPENRKKNLGRKLSLICIAGVLADVAAYYIKGNSSNLLFSLLAFLLYIVFAGITMMVQHGEQEKLLLEKEVELSESRTAIMLSQIQPHFLYNVLNTIYHLCGKEPETAQEAVSTFADYLRNNMASVEKKEPIPFDEEYRHVQTYLSLERIRFQDELDVVYDIEVSSFKLPPLTVQPLVENAVKHGVTKKRGGGRVTISTRETDDSYTVTVSDTGVGFDPERYMEDGKVHIGIKNVQERLRVMVGGTLTVTSTPGSGTTAVVAIPKKEETQE